MRALFPLLAAALIAAPLAATAFTPEKTSRVDRLINADSRTGGPETGPRVSDPNAKALDGPLAYEKPLPNDLEPETDLEVLHSADRLVLEPKREEPLNGELQLD